MDRREFLKLVGTAAAGAAVASPLIAQDNAETLQKAKVAPRPRNPYKGIDWGSCLQIHSTTHGHCTNQNRLDAFVKERGFGLLTISNYYPSAPYCPAKAMTVNYYRLHHDFPVMVDGKRTDGPFDWNKIVAPWVDELDEKFKSQFPFKEGGPMFKDVPDGILEAPNAEHHAFTDSRAHICAPGSAFASGTFDAHNDFHTVSNGKYCHGVGEPWRKAFDRMFQYLIVPDGGGVTINHPTWSKFPREQMIEMLDYDPRVLGIEVFNESAGNKKSYPWSDSYSEDYWDYVLSMGRQCFGFFVPDWGLKEGTNVLLVPERTVEACMRAYRNGQWYGAIKGRHLLDFKLIAFDGRTLTARTDKPAKFQVISKQGVIFENVSSELSFQIDAADYAKNVFLRIKAFATDDSGEIIFSQPFMLD